MPKKRKKTNKQLVKLEKQQITLEKKQLKELQDLEKLEQQIKKAVTPKPLGKITSRDFFKSLVGAFIGVGVHYTFTYGVEISQHLGVLRTHFLYLLSFIIIILFIYATGFRKIEIHKHTLFFIPLRISILYITLLLVSIFVLITFYPNFMALPFQTKYTQIATLLLPAVIGACTADLIGKE